MHAAHADGDALTGVNLEAALFVLRARHQQGGAGIAVRLREQRGLRAILEAHAQALERAGEHHLVHHPAREVTGAEAIARRRNLHFLRAYHRDHFVLVDAGRTLGRSHRVGAHLDAIGRAARQDQVGRAEEGGHETRRGARVQIVRFTQLEQPPEIHDPDAVRHREGFLLVVGHEHGGDPELALHLADGAAQFLADLRVQGSEGLIEQQHFGLVRQRARHRHTLLLAAGELRRQPLIQPLERNQAQQLLAALPARFGAHVPHAQRELDVLRHRHMAEQRVVLEHQPHAALAGGDVRDVAAVQRDAAMVDAGQPGDGAQQGALAAAAGPEQHEKLPVTDVERDVVDHRRAGVPLGDLIQGNGHCGDATGAVTGSSVSTR